VAFKCHATQFEISNLLLTKWRRSAVSLSTIDDVTLGRRTVGQPVHDDELE